ncbi:hypothetical protein AAFP30_14740 [Gordonia sp. CPCC 205515]|uniref:hypothetical protein n=1 Tax=Gordonia sp. CPCC 205515 TaxID=3140791 RepID=UPI003AF38FF8
MDQYDPRFGAALYRGTWNADCGHATALAMRRPHCACMPTDGDILFGAMDQKDADKAMSL